ncbi:mitochondrial ornithine transporter 1-like [Diadema setosum]|uniref:mitochondrial ornithine transporter 1-like n=1 Tax=Diadema setosum TaxID=31175 RepID=UPI003B3BA6D3
MEGMASSAPGGNQAPALTPSRKMVELYEATVDFTAGAIGGVACTIVGQPFDTVKVKMQTYPHLYKSSMHCLRHTLGKEGVRGLFEGTTPALAAIVGESAVLFMCYGLCQKGVSQAVGKEHVSQLTSVQKALSGSFAAFFSSLVLCPTELVKCRMQAMTEVMAVSDTIHKKIGPWQVTKDLVKQDGPLGLFQGLTSTWLREMPGYFAFFFGYEMSKELLTPAGKTQEELSFPRLALAGGVAGASLWTAIYPIDVVKSRIQVQSLVGKMPGFLPTFINMVKTEGVASLFSGVYPCIIRAFPANAAMLIAYEGSRSWMRNHRPGWIS